MSVCYCSVDGCFNKVGDGLSFFRCPKDEQRILEWKNALGFTEDHRYASLTADECNCRIRVCSVHFSENCFSNVARNRIYKYAVPSLNLRPLTSGNNESCDTTNLVDASVQTDFVYEDTKCLCNRFPTDPEKRKKWFSVMGLEANKVLAKHPEICSDHFNPKDIITRANGLKYVTRGADPTHNAELFEETSSTSSAASSEDFFNLPPTDQVFEVSLPSTSRNQDILVESSVESNIPQINPESNYCELTSSQQPEPSRFQFIKQLKDSSLVAGSTYISDSDTDIGKQRGRNILKRITMPGMRCTVLVCSNSRLAVKQSGKDICFYRFPKDKNLRQIWVQRCKRGGKWDPKNCRVCSEHFTEGDYERDLQAELLNLPAKRKLKTAAVPSVNLVQKSTPISTTKKEKRKRAAKSTNTLLGQEILQSEINYSDLSQTMPIVASLPTPSTSEIQEENEGSLDIK